MLNPDALEGLLKTDTAVDGVEDITRVIDAYSGEMEVSEVRGGGGHAIDFRLKDATGEPFRSGIVYYGGRVNEVEDPTIRFSSDLVDDYSIRHLRTEFADMVEEAKFRAGAASGWTSYPRGDVGLGPHVIYNGRVDPAGFVRFFAALMDEYHSRF